MDSGLKQRLVGAVVLVALAVIFLPMLLDGSGARERLNEDIAIPEQPEAPESRLDQEDSGTRDGGMAEESTADATLATDEFGSGDTEIGGETGDQGPSEPAGGATAQDSTGAAGDGRGDGASREEPLDEGWVVQVGSFRRETNAIVLRDRLRDDGFDATAEQVETDSGTMWRVWIGPVAVREEGEALEKRIEDRRGSNALLMEYSQ